MEHFYKNLTGYFTFPDFYSQMVNKFDNAKFVEVGCMHGQSISYLAVEIINSNKNIELICIDNWLIKSNYDKFVENIKPIEDKIKYYRMESVDAAKMFPDKSLDFVFIDAAHGYVHVNKDINAWKNKVKIGGILSGHDINMDDVKKAVSEHFPNYKTEKGNCWSIEII